MSPSALLRFPVANSHRQLVFLSWAVQIPSIFINSERCIGNRECTPLLWVGELIKSVCLCFETLDSWAPPKKRKWSPTECPRRNQDRGWQHLCSRRCWSTHSMHWIQSTTYHQQPHCSDWVHHKHCPLKDAWGKCLIPDLGPGMQQISAQWPITSGRIWKRLRSLC